MRMRMALQDEWNLYGAQPMHMNVEYDGNANAVLLLNSNALGEDGRSPCKCIKLMSLTRLIHGLRHYE